MTAKAVSDYAEVGNLTEAHAHIEAMLATPLGQEHPDALLRAIRTDAFKASKRTDHEVARPVGASLVALAVNQRLGVQS